MVMNYILVSNKTDAIVYATENQLLAVKILRAIAECGGDADMYKLCETAEVASD